MTLIHAPWAVDGARSSSALARVSTYATGGGRSGTVRPGDLKVSPLSPNGNGVQIASGAAVILNGYQSNPREAYAVANNGTHIVPAGDMPAPVPATAYYLVCIVVGDPEFNQAGHPFMPSAILPEDAAEYEYVRAVIVPCSANTTRFEQLGLNYPAYALARLEVPANTTTITDAMLTDLREISAPRQERQVIAGGTSAWNTINSLSWVQFCSINPTVSVPPWATKMIITVRANGVIHNNPALSGHTRIRSSANNATGPETTYEYESTGNPSGTERISLQTAWTMDCSAIAGQVTTLEFQARRAGGDGTIKAADSEASGTSIVYDVQFIEASR